MTKIRFYWSCLPESAVETSEDKYYLNYLATTHFNKNHLKYNLTFVYLIELLRVVFKISRANAYSEMSNAFSIDALPRSTPTKNGLKKSADKIPSKFIDKLRVLNQKVSNSAVPDIYHLIITNSGKSLPSIEIQSSPPNEREFYSSESLTFDKRRIDNKTIESNDLKLFYIDNISLITKLRSMSYLEEQKVTQELLARLLSPFWLAKDRNTTLDAQKRLLKKVLEEKKVLSKSQVSYQFHQEASLPRTARYNKVRLIKVIIDSETVKYALHIMHHIEGIFIVILADKISVIEVSKEPEKGNRLNYYFESSLNNWLQNLNSGEESMIVNFHYKQAKNGGSYPDCKVEVNYNVNKDEGDYNYMLQQSSDVLIVSGMLMQRIIFGICMRLEVLWV